MVSRQACSIRLRVSLPVGHMWIEGTTDGGASDWITYIDGHEMKRLLREPVDDSLRAPLDWKDPSVQGKGFSKPDKIHCYCRCRGVEFYVSPPGKNAIKLFF